MQKILSYGDTHNSSEMFVFYCTGEIGFGAERWFEVIGTGLGSGGRCRVSGTGLELRGGFVAEGGSNFFSQ